MDTTNENNQKACQFAIGTSLKTNKIIIVCINAFMMLPIIIRNYTLLGLGISVALLLISTYIVVLRSDSSLPAGAYYTTLIFFDFFIYIGLQYKILKGGFSTENLSSIFETIFTTKMCLWLLLLGAIVGFIGLVKHNFTWFTGISAAAFGSAFILSILSNKNIEDLQFVTGGEAFLASFLIAVLFWTVLLEMSTRIVPEKRTINIWLGIILLVSIIALCITEVQYVHSIASDLSSKMLALPTTAFAWWKVIVSCIVLIGCSVAMYDNKHQENQIGIDSFLMIASAIFVFAIKLLMGNYFIYSSLLMLLLVIATFRCLHNELLNKKTCRLNTATFLIVETIVFLLTLHTLKNGYWINAIVTVVFVIIFYSQYERMKAANNKSFLWIAIISVLVVEALAWQWKMRFSVEGVIILATVYIVSVATILILNYPHPGKIVPNRNVNIFVCICVALLCLASVRTTMRVKADVSTENEVVTISVEAKGKRNDVESISCEWIDYRGKTVGNEPILIKSEQAIPVQSDVLRVIANDAKGYRAIYYYWFPSWLYNFEPK